MLEIVSKDRNCFKHDSLNIRCHPGKRESQTGYWWRHMNDAISFSFYNAASWAWLHMRPSNWIHPFTIFKNNINNINRTAGHIPSMLRNWRIFLLVKTLFRKHPLSLCDSMPWDVLPTSDLTAQGTYQSRFGGPLKVVNSRGKVPVITEPVDHSKLIRSDRLYGHLILTKGISSFPFIPIHLSRSLAESSSVKIRFP